MDSRLRVFLSYHRESAKWQAGMVKEKLERHDVDVFMDIASINAGRFETVILNEIGRREHFIALLTPEACKRLRSGESWSRRELERALELRKNVVPVLLDDTTLGMIPPEFPMRAQLLALNAFPLPFEFLTEAIARLHDRFLLAPTIEDQEIQTAAEHFRAGEAFQEREEWAKAEREYEQAVHLRRRPEYLVGLSTAKREQGRDLEALNDLDAAMVADPFAPELMKVKFDLLKEMDRMQEAIDLAGGAWRAQAEQRARTIADRIVKNVTAGADLVDAVRSVPELMFLYGHMPVLGRIGASMGSLLQHTSGDLEKQLREIWESWRSRHEHDLREDWESWNREASHPDRREDRGRDLD